MSTALESTVAPVTEEKPNVVKDFKSYVETRNKVVNDAPTVITEVVESKEASVASIVDNKTVETEAEDEPVQHKKGYQKRISQLTTEREAARAETARIAKELEDLKTSKPVVETKAPAGPVFETVKPDMSQFSTIGEYTEALSDWKDEKREFERTQKAQKEAQEQAAKKFTETWQTREVDVKAAFDDYEAVVNVDAVNAANLTPASRNFLSDSEFGPQVLYELFQNDELANKFKDSLPYQQVKILTKIETGIENAKEATTKTTKAKSENLPAPPSKLATSGMKITEATIFEASGKKDFAEYAKLRKAQKQARR